MKVFEHQIIVKESDIDELNHVNNVIYLKWINLTSALHWNSVSNKEINSKYIWVAARHEIDYIKPAFLHEKIILKTYIDTIEGVKSTRKVEIYRNNTLLAKSFTIWVLLDAKTQKITRIPKEISNLF